MIYKSNGTAFKSSGLDDIYSRDEVQKFQRSVSSVWWRCSTPPVMENNPPQIPIQDSLGNVLSVNYQTGAVKKAGKHRSC